MTPIPTGPVLASGTDEPQQRLAADSDRGQEVAVGVVELDDAQGVRRRLEDRPDRQDAVAQGHLALRVERAVAVLQVQCDDARAETPEKGRDVCSPGERPVRVDLED